MTVYRTLLAGILFAGLTTTLSAADTVRYETAARPSTNEMVIEGHATGHSWHVKGTIISGAFEVEPAWQKDISLKSVTCLGEGKTPPVCELGIPINSLKSQVVAGASVMDDRMKKEMKAAEFPRIRYKLTEMTPTGDVPASGTPVTFATKGQLSMAGKTNEVSFPIKMDRLEGDKLLFTGTYKMKMTQFGITPPEFTIMGIGSKTADDVTLTWKWTVGVKPPAPAQ